MEACFLFLSTSRASLEVRRGEVHGGGDTVYLCAVDERGNACSFINSNYAHFGTGLVPEGCGFTLQVGKGKAPYSTVLAKSMQ